MVLCVTEKGGLERGVGGRSNRDGIFVHKWLIHFIVQQKLTQPCKATLFPIKNDYYLITGFIFFLLKLRYN